MQRIVTQLLFGSLLLLSSMTKADLLTASIKYHSGEYQEALIAFNQLAELGNKDAIYNIAVMYMHGQGVDKDLTKAYAWFNLAAEMGLEEAGVAAKMVEQQVEQPQVLNQAYQQLVKSFDLAHYSKALQPQFDVNAAANWLQPHTKVKAKYPKQAHSLGLEGWVWLEFDVDKFGVVTDVDVIDGYPDRSFNRAASNAVRYWRYPSDTTQNAQAVKGLQWVKHFTTYKGKRYQATFSRQQRQYQQKINQLIERAEQGSGSVQYHIANWLLGELEGEEHNATRLLKYHWSGPDAGHELLLSAAVNGYAKAQYRLGVNLLYGYGVVADRNKALNWIGYAAEQDFAPAQYRMALELIKQQPDLAATWLVKAAELGYFRAIRDLIEQLIDKKQFQQAQLWLEKAFEQDDEHPMLWQAQAKVFAGLDKTQASEQAAFQAKEYAKDRGWNEKVR